MRDPWCVFTLNHLNAAVKSTSGPQALPKDSGGGARNLNPESVSARPCSHVE